ncbi:hypothetical protein [Geobacillus kaustophilus]|uniref:hypothetical protein n=1 Tax=Geobacillus kaustophilus TaxID=1462 RepID=UPI000AA8D636|nr:hypothetical protein [Geobacillus kaustophilus]
MRISLDLSVLFDMQEALDHHIRRKQNIPAEGILRQYQLRGYRLVNQYDPTDTQICKG